jgi:hypothetical protein
MFSEKGLRHLESYLWQRALLSLGDYLLPSGRNSSFLGNTARDEASWKRLLSGTGQGQRALQARNVLKKLFCRLTLDSDISEQLQQVISEAEQLEPWREAVVNCPAVIDYCERNSIRKDDSGTIYLLKRSQMNGTHAELFTFCFYNELLTSDENCDQALAPLKLEEYYSSTETAIEPGIRFYWSGDTEKFFKLESDNDCFILYRILDRDENNPPFIDFLAGKPEFKLTEKRLERKCAYPDIRCVINDIRKHLTEFTERQNDLASR